MSGTIETSVQRDAGAELSDRVIHHVLRRWAKERPSAPFVKCGGDWVTFAEMDARSDALAGGLHGLGIQAGDRVAVALANCEEFLVLIFALAKLGAIQVPLNVFLKGDFLRHQLSDSGARLLVTDAKGVEQARPVLAHTAVERLVVVEEVADPPLPADRFDAVEAAGGTFPEPATDPADIVSIIYTSGTTGMPKGCLFSHGYYTIIPSAYREAEWCLPEDRIFTAMPMFHTGGQAIILMSALTMGTSAVYEREFSASTFMRRAAEEEATMLFGVAAMGMAILATPPVPDEPKGFRLATWIPMPPDRQAAFLERFDTPVVVEGYGQSECAPATLNHIRGDRRPASAGTPVHYLDVRLLDDEDREVPVGEVGEICLRPKEPLVMYSGYWNSPEATVAAWRNLWHHTGDFAKRDEDGFLYFVDRKKDAMRRRGENVSSLELEAAILRHPKVGAVAVHAVPSDLGEDEIKACVVPASADAPPTAEELFEHFKRELPYFAVPTYVELRESLPVNAMGRVQKHLLRDQPFTEATWDLTQLGLVVSRDDRR